MPARKEPPQETDVDAFIALFYAAASRLFLMRRAIAKSLDLNSPELAALLALSRLDKGKGVRIRSLADDVHVASANMTATINALKASGWVRKGTDEEDNRAVRVFLSDMAKTRLKALATNRHRINGAWFSGISSDQLLQSCAALKALIRNYDHAMAIANSLNKR